MVDNMAHLERIVARLPEAERVDIEAWGGEPTFRVPEFPGMARDSAAA